MCMVKHGFYSPQIYIFLDSTHIWPHHNFHTKIWNFSWIRLCFIPSSLIMCSVGLKLECSCYLKYFQFEMSWRGGGVLPAIMSCLLNCLHVIHFAQHYVYWCTLAELLTLDWWWGPEQCQLLNQVTALSTAYDMEKCPLNNGTITQWPPCIERGCVGFSRTWRSSNLTLMDKWNNLFRLHF